MELKVQNKLQELKFGIGFVRKLDKKYFTSKGGIEFGLGLHLAYPMLLSRNLTVLSDVIRCAIAGTVSELSVDNALDAYAEENDGLETLFEDVIEGLKNSNSLKATIQVISTEMEEQLDQA